jgi:hypothetical protein
MKIGDEIVVQIAPIIEPLIGRLVTVTLEGKDVRARIISAQTDPMYVPTVRLKVVPNETKE